MSTQLSFNDFTKKLPFLQQIPQTISSQLSVDEFYFPDQEVDEARRRLELAFGQYVMSYKAGVFRKDLPFSAHLCANYKGAILSAKQVALLNFCESICKSRNVSFVVYQKPLTQISIQESPFFKGE